MDWRTEIRNAFGARGRTPDNDVVEELAQHAAAAHTAARADGQSDEDAKAHVLGLIDGWSQGTAAGPRRGRRTPLFEAPSPDTTGWAGLSLDLRFALRVLRRRPAAALVSAVTMALGIGAATTLFGVAYSVLARPLPYPDADRLVRLSETRERSTRVLPPFFTNGTFLAWKDHPSTLAALAAWDNDTATIRPTGDAPPERGKVISATASLFDVLEARPDVGRLFTQDEETASRSHVAVISYATWQRLYGGRPDVTSQTIEVDGTRDAIVGVMPASFTFPDRETMLWAPMEVTPAAENSVMIFRGIGRLKPGVSADQASAEGTARGRSAPALGMVGVAVFGSDGKVVASAVPLLEAMTGDVRPALLMMLAAVGLLLATAVMNISSMQLASASSRRREMAIRAALGGSGRRLARQLFVEHALVAVGGGAAGLMLTLLLYRWVPALLPADFPRLEDLAVGWPVAAFALLATAAAGGLVGLAPTMLARRLNLVEALTEDSLAPVGGSLRTRVARTRAFIMTGQVAAAAVLLVGAALVSQSFVGLLHAHRGYRPDNLLTARLPLPDREFSGPQRAALVDALLDRLHHSPGVTDAAATSILPLVPTYSLMSFTLPPGGSRREPATIQTGSQLVSPDYFKALGIQVTEGRPFSDTDTPTSEPVAIVNESFARTYLDGHALGTDLPVGLSGHDNWRVVGVVEDVHQHSATEPTQPENLLHLPADV